MLTFEAMLVILTAYIYYCPEQRSKIAFTTDESGSNLPLEDCENWMHWKNTTISGDIANKSIDQEITDIDILKGLMANGYFIGSELNMKLELGLY